MFIPREGEGLPPLRDTYHHFTADIKAASATSALIIKSVISKAVGFFFFRCFLTLSPPF